MSWIGVITGDIVNSTEILNSGHREKLLEVLHKTVEEINVSTFNESKFSDNIKIDVYRGDSFQILVRNPRSTMNSAILIRTALIASSTDGIRWDARLGIGIGKGEFITDSVSESDGEAFRLSGEAFDKLKVNDRLMVLTPNEDFNDELAVSTGFADNIISNWTILQSKLIYLLLLKLDTKQKEIARKIGESPQVVSKRLISSKFILIIKYSSRFLSKLTQINP